MTRLVWRRWEGRRPTGIDRVCLAYLDQFGSRSQAVIQHRHGRRLLGTRSSAKLFELLRAPPGDLRRALVKGGLGAAIHGPLEGKGRLYLNVGHTGLNDPRFRRWLGQNDVRPIYFVHDLIPVTHPEFCRQGEMPKHHERMRTVLSTGTGIVANSEATLRDLEAFAQAEKLTVPPSLAALLGSTPFERHEPSKAINTRPYFVILGTIEARKNHLMLLHVWTRMVEKLGDSAPQLLVIGQRGWEAEQVLDILDRGERLKGTVVEIGGCSDQELTDYLVNARALLFPSLVEGYGLPLVEALRSGTPAIASDLAVFREIAQDVPDYLDPLDGPAWERAILDFAQADSAMRLAQLSRLEGYNAPTWADHFEAVEAWMTTL